MAKGFRILSTAVLAVSLLGTGAASAQSFLEAKVVEIGREVPDFDLMDLSGKDYKLSNYRGQVVMVHFWSSTCPFVLRYEERLQAITSDYKDKGVAVLAIDSNANETPAQMKKVAEKRRVNYPILIDRGNRVADEFGAITTPHVFIIDSDGKLRYEGAVDDQGWSEAGRVKQKYVRDALDEVLAGKNVLNPITRTVGCTVKRVY